LDVTNDLVGTIEQVSTAVMPSGVGEMTINSVMVSGELIEFSMAGGAPGRSYLVKVDVTPVGAAPVEYVCWIYIDRTLATWPIANPPSFTFGSPILWSFTTSLDFSKAQNSWMLMCF
jgi:hypothetical protein